MCVAYSSQMTCASDHVLSNPPFFFYRNESPDCHRAAHRNLQVPPLPARAHPVRHHGLQQRPGEPVRVPGLLRLCPPPHPAVPVRTSGTPRPARELLVVCIRSYTSNRVSPFYLFILFLQTVLFAATFQENEFVERFISGLALSRTPCARKAR